MRVSVCGARETRVRIRSEGALHVPQVPMLLLSTESGNQSVFKMDPDSQQTHLELVRLDMLCIVPLGLVGKRAYASHESL